MIETDRWTFVQAKNFKKIVGQRRAVRLVVIHSMDDPGGERKDTAERVARYFKTTDTPASAHICVDCDSIVQCVRDNDVAFAAPGANGDGIQIELAGFSSQSPTAWLDPYSIAVLELGASATAQYCIKYEIAVCHLTNTQLADPTARGIIGHRQASKVFKKSNHTDPGENFPWEMFMERVSIHYAARKIKYGV